MTSRDDTLSVLAGIPARRADLDAVERSAIDAARAAGAGWSAIADALGLGSRQAAEQRRLRLSGTVRPEWRRQQNLDKHAGTPIIALRTAAADLAIALGDLPAEPGIQLARTTLLMAADAEPGALVDLARLALADLSSPSIMRLMARHAGEQLTKFMIDAAQEIERAALKKG